MTTKTQNVTVAGVIVKAELSTVRDNFSGDRYSRGREYYAVTVKITLRGDDGEMYFFSTPAAKFSVNTSGPYSVAIVEPNDWVTKQNWECEGFAGACGFGKTPVSRVKVGDRIKIKGRVKGPKDLAWGTPLWYVKRLDYSFDAENAAYYVRVENALKVIPNLYSRPDLTPPELPGVDWERIGGYPHPEDEGHITVPSGMPHGHVWTGWTHKITDCNALIAHVEGVPVESVVKPD